MGKLTASFGWLLSVLVLVVTVVGQAIAGMSRKLTFNQVKSSHSIQLAMEAVADVDIDDDGVFKYVLISVSKDGHSKPIVRGYKSEEYHGAQGHVRC
jgi:hypothetical protein